MRIGLLGTSRIGGEHATTLATLSSVDTLVVADVVTARAEVVAGRVGADVASSPEALFESGLDGVVIATSTAAHPDLISAAIDAGVPAFCEKPVARTVAGSVEVLRRVESSDVPVHIGLQRRFDPGFQAARAAVASGELGWLHTVRSTTLDPAPPTPEYVAGSGGLFRDCGVHDFDSIRWVTGREVLAVYATGGNRGEDFFVAAEDVDTGAAVLTLDDQTLALVSMARYNARGYDVRLEVHGSDDSIAVGLEDRLPLRSVEPDSGFPAGTPWPRFAERFAAAYRAELAAFVESLRGEPFAGCTVAEAVEAEWIAEACTRSLAEHRPVRLDEVRSW